MAKLGRATLAKAYTESVLAEFNPKDILALVAAERSRTSGRAHLRQWHPGEVHGDAPGVDEGFEVLGCITSGA